jgi:perosamine synthetase
MSLAGQRDGPLAIHGGRPVRRTLLPYGRQTVTEEDIHAVVDVLRSDWITTGPKVGEFEEAFAARVGAAHAVSFSSGTAALHGAVFAAGLGPGDQAVTTPLTFCATSNAILYQGAQPVFADVCPDTLNLDPGEVARRLSPATRAIVAVDYAGHPSDLDALAELAGRRGLALIEDACHALGARYRGRAVGAAGSAMTVFSFHPVKHIATGEGGMVTTSDAGVARRLRLFRNHGIESGARERQASGTWFYEMVALGYNYRLTDIACALGLSQLARLDANLAARARIAADYGRALSAIPGLVLPAARPGVEHAWHLYPVRLEASFAGSGRAQVFAALRAEGIGVNVHYIPVHLHPFYRERLGLAAGAFPVAEEAYERLVSLPMFHGMTSRDVEDVVAAMHKVLAYFGREAGGRSRGGTAGRGGRRGK